MNQIVEYTPKVTFRKSIIEQKKFSIQFLPESLHSFSQKDYFYFREKKLKSSYIIDLIHTLILKYYFKKENLYHLSSLVLKDKYGYLYNYYIEWLLENNILILVYNTVLLGATTSLDNDQTLRLLRRILDIHCLRNT